jgi:hypothetical protein
VVIAMKSLSFVVCIAFALDSLSAQTSGWKLVPGHAQVPVWPGAVPDARPDRVENSLSSYVALKKAGVPVEMHMHAQGGYAFGLWRKKFPATA